MTTSALMVDARMRPDLFHWNGRMVPGDMAVWIAKHAWLGRFPRDLVELWQETGGGEVFESETILGPAGDPHMGEDIAAVNRAMRSRGMPARFLVFHMGLLLSAVDTEAGDYVELDPTSFRVRRHFASLDGWYESTLRAEYRVRYGLQ